MSVTINGTTGIDAVQSGTIDLTTDVTGVLPSSNGGTATTVGYNCFKNRIINGAMMIDQRNAGASVNGNNVYTVDRWFAGASQNGKYTAQRNAGSVTPPIGYINYLGITSSSAYSVLTGDYFGIIQYIEGLNVADLGWGTANAQAVTLSFWVRSSLTGTFGGSLSNSAANRSYPFSYTISSANTWEQKTITIAGDTTGTWLTTNGTGIALVFALGYGSTYSGTAGSWAAGQFYSVTGATSVVGTNGATFYITGVQLEKGSTATSFDYRPYGTELQLCQRYYQKSYPQGTVPGTATDSGLIVNFIGAATTSPIYTTVQYPVIMRATPTFTSYSHVTGASGKVYKGTDNNANAIYGSDSHFSNGTDATTSAPGLYFQYTLAAEL